MQGVGSTLKGLLPSSGGLFPLWGSVPILRVLPHIEGLSPFSKVCPHFGVCLPSND